MRLLASLQDPATTSGVITYPGEPAGAGRAQGDTVWEPGTPGAKGRLWMEQNVGSCARG